MNIDPDLAFADGMHAGELERVKEQLGEEWMKKTVRRPMLAVEFVARRIDEQLEAYKSLMSMAWKMVSEAFSEKVIDVGVTTADVSNMIFLKVEKIYISLTVGSSMVVPRSNSGPQRLYLEYASCLHYPLPSCWATPSPWVGFHH